MHPEMMIRNIKCYAKKTNKKITLVFIFVTLFTVLIVCRMISVQIIGAAKIEQICLEKNRIIMKDRAERGNIIDNEGNYIAINIFCNNIYIMKKRVLNKHKLAQKIANTGIMPYDEILTKLDSPYNYIPLYYNVPDNKIHEIEKIIDESIIIKREKIRYYNHSDIFSSITGFVGIDCSGLEGIEFEFDSNLKGTDGFIQYQRKPNGKIYKHPSYKDKPAQMGQTIQLTLNSEIQQIAFFSLKNYVDRYNATNGNVIIMEVKTGKILAMASYPSYDANLMGRGDPTICKNYSVLSLFEPGSIFKLITAAAALEYNIVKEDDYVKKENEDSLIINGHIIKDSHKSGALTFKESFIESSNIGFVNIGNKIGKRLLYVMINAMGINKKVNVGLPGEQKGLLLNEREWIPIHQANICFGQGVSVTALQMIAAYNIVANKGYYINPQIINKIGGKDYSPSLKKRILKKSTSSRLNEMLISTVKSGTGIKANIPGVTVAGKTGTAEKSSSQGGYLKHEFTSSFVGYFPAEDPKIIMIVIIDEPKGIYWGSEVAAPLFRSIAENIIGLKQYRYMIKPFKEIHS